MRNAIERKYASKPQDYLTLARSLLATLTAFGIISALTAYANFLFSVGRHVGIEPDDNEIIVIELDQPLGIRGRR